MCSIEIAWCNTEHVLKALVWYLNTSFVSKMELLAQCLASYLGDLRKFSMFFSVVFQASTGKKLWGKNHGKNHGTLNSDAKHSTNDLNSRGNLSRDGQYQSLHW